MQLEDARLVYQNLDPRVRRYEQKWPKTIRINMSESTTLRSIICGAALAMTSRRRRTLPTIRTHMSAGSSSTVTGATHMNFGSTLVHNASVDFINLLCGTSAL